jgi:cytoskeletal protein CcmA (bactofilin family)
MTVATWTGAGCPSNCNWSNPANWANGQVPSGSDELTFPAVTQSARTSHNDLWLAPHRLWFLGSGYSITGNVISLGGDIEQLLPGDNVLALEAVSLSQSSTVDITAGSLTLHGALEGNTIDAGIVKQGGGALVLEDGPIAGVSLDLRGGATTLRQESVYRGDHATLVSSGTLDIENSVLGVTVQNSGTLGLHGSNRFTQAVTNTFGGHLKMGPDGVANTFEQAVTNQASSIFEIRDTTFNGPVSNQSAYFTTSGNVTFNDALTNQGSNYLELDRSVTCAFGLTNQGTLRLNGQLTVQQGTVVNAAGASFSFTNQLSLDSFDNQGNLVVNGVGTFGQLTNSGTVTLYGTLTTQSFTNSNSVMVHNDLVVQNPGAVPYYANTGTISIDAGEQVTLDAFGSLPALGTVNGPGTLALTHSTVALASDFTNQIGATLELNGCTVYGPGNLINAAGKSLRLVDTSVYAAIDNPGTITATGTADTLGSNLTTEASSVLEVAAAAGGTTLTAYPFGNAGEVRLTGSAGGDRATLVIGGGYLVNGGTVTVHGTATLNASFLTFGSSVLRVDGDPTGSADLTIPNGFTNNGLLVVTSTHPNHASLTVQSGTLTNAGTLQLVGDSTFSGALASSGSIYAAGNVSLSGGLTTTATSLLSVPSAGTTTLNIQGSFTSYGRVELAGVNPTLYILGSFTNYGHVELTGVNPSLSVTTFQLQQAPSNPFGPPGPPPRLLLVPGTLINAAGATFQVTNTAHLLNGNLTNAGTLNIDNGQTLDLFDNTYNHSGGSLTGPGTLSLSTGGVVNLATALTLNGEELHLTSATVNGPGALNVNNGKLVVRGTSAVNAPLTTTSSSSIQVDADPMRSTTLTVANGFTNNGNLEVYGLPVVNSAPLTATLTISTGNLTNAGTLRAKIATLNAGLLATTTSSVLVEGTASQTGSANVPDLTISNGFTNNGMIGFSGSSPTLAVTSGTLVNARQARSRV